MRSSAFIPVYCLALLASGMCPGSAKAQTKPPLVPICDLLNSPEKFDKQTIRLRGIVHLEFEEFTLTSPSCPGKRPGIWLAFGGDVPTPTMSTANDTQRPPGFAPKVGGVPVRLQKDDNFERFFALITARHVQHSALYKVTATLTGVFLAGRPKPENKSWPYLPGYGHMSALHLFIVTRVDDSYAEPRPYLDISGRVSDAAGTPLSGVAIYSQTANQFQSSVNQVYSDGAGSFSVKNAGQVLTFAKEGYAPQTLILERGRKDLVVTLTSKASADWRLLACKDPSSNAQFPGLPLSVFIAKDLHSEQMSSKSDSPFIIHRRVGDPQIRLSNANPNAPFAASASRIFDSEEFTQRNVLSTEGKWIGLDSKGSQQGKIFWRIVALPGREIVQYYVMSRDAASVFDDAIDSACLKSR
jgi:hypothetical protein